MSFVDVLGAAYEVSTVVTDVILNKEYIKRNWVEEYIVSIVFLVFNGIVMGLLGVVMHQESSRRRPGGGSYTAIERVVSFLIGVLQLRVLVETWAAFRREKHESSGGKPTMQTDRSSDSDVARQRDQDAKTQAQRLPYFLFVQCILRDVPLFILQANATIHYRKWKLLDFWAVGSSGVTLLRAVCAYISKRPVSDGVDKEEGDTLLSLASLVFVLGQFVFRLGAILLVAMTVGLTVVYYAIAIIILSVGWAVVLRLASPMQAWQAQLGSAVLFFPFYTVFVVDASNIASSSGNATDTLVSTKLWILHAWRFLENGVGMLLAIVCQRYTDFGISTDAQVIRIGLACFGVYVLCLVVFLLAVQHRRKNPLPTGIPLNIQARANPIHFAHYADGGLV